MPLASQGFSGRTVVPVDIQRDVFAAFGVVDRIGEATVFDSNACAAKVVTHQLVAKRIIGEAVIADEVRVEPGVLGVLHGIVVLVGSEPHGMSADSVLVINNLGMSAVPTNILGLLQSELAMG